VKSVPEVEVTLPVGRIKLLKCIKLETKENEGFSFKLAKTIKIENSIICSYETLIKRLVALEKLQLKYAT
jgi:hypothetical protein